MKRKIQFIDQDSWARRAVEHIPCGIAPFVLKGADNTRTRVTPSMARYRDLTILGGDWLAVTPDGKCALDGMVPIPGAYPAEAKNVIRGLSGLETTTEAAIILSAPSVVIGGTSKYERWLLHYLPRLLLTRKLGLLQGRLVLLNADLQPFQREALEMLGVSLAQQFGVHDQSAVFAHDVLVPALMAHTIVTHPCVPELLRESFPPSMASGQRRVYLSRSDARTRRLTNEDELVRLLERFDFETHVPGRMSFQQQIDLFAGADTIVAAQGSALANSVFCPRGAQVIEIRTPSYKASSLHMLSAVLGLGLTFVLARESSSGSQIDHSDWQVDLGAMEIELNRRFLGAH